MTLEEYRNQQHEIDLVFFHGIFKTQNAHGGRNVMPRCLSEGVDIFSKSVERQGRANRTFKASGCCHGWQLEPCPYGLESLYHFSIENSHLETRHQGVMFRSPRAFVGSMATLRYEPCTQFINVSQRALHIYFIDGCRVCPVRPDARYIVKNKNSDL